MMPALVFGGGTGLGLWLLLVWAAPARPRLSDQWAPLARTDSAPTLTDAAEAPWVTRWGRRVTPALRRFGLPGAGIAADLRITGRGPATHLATQVLLAAAALLTPALAAVLLALTGAPIAVEVPVLAGLAGAAVGFLVPDLHVRGRARRLRREFRDALSAYLDLVWITLAGGAGIEAALADAADVGTGPAFTAIRRSLGAAHLTRTTPWESLRRLGEELEITELSELAAAISLAGTEGARVRTSLAAKARALRTHQITDAEREAQAATERMALPVTLLFVGFLGFIAYPAVLSVLNGL
ncbi:type II secretion system F family protein [Prauserella alba]|nr:type II secretion system F family protein [Prauserella alba]MCP2182161.1 Type II secretion system (T2SS), protein F [Prauserella alba]